MAEATDWSTMDPEIRERRAESADALRERVRQRNLEESRRGVERMGDIRTADQLLQFIEQHGVEGVQERRLEKKYGGGLMGRWHRFMSGEMDVEVDEEGQTRHNYVTELARRGLRTIFNRKTLIGGLALAGIGALSGGIGAIGLPALYSFMGAMGGRAVAEGIGMASGAERKARARLKRAEYNEAWEMEELAAKYHDEPDPGKQADILLKLVGTFHSAADVALAPERGAAERQLADVLKKQENLRAILELSGMATGIGYGFVEAGWQAASGAANAGEGYGVVDADLDGAFHEVATQNGQWHSLYNSIGEAGEAAKNGATVVATLGEHGGHLVQGDALFGAKVYAWAGARALGVVGAMYAGEAMGSAMDASQKQSRAELANEYKADHARIKSSIEATRPAPLDEDEREDRLETSRDTMLRIDGLGDTLTELQVYVSPPTGTPGAALALVPWNPSWKYARLAERIPARGAEPERYRLEFYTDDDLVRSGTADQSYTVTRDTYQMIYEESKDEHPAAPLDRDAQTALLKLVVDQHLTEVVGKPIAFRPGVDAAKLRILHTADGYPRPGNLEPKGKYELVEYSTQTGVATLRNSKTGDTELVGLRELSKVLAPVKPAARSEATPTPGTAETGASSTSTEAKASWKDVTTDLEIRGEPKPKAKDIWVATSDIEGEVAAGGSKGDEETLTAGERYSIRSIDTKTGYVILVPATGGTPVRVHAEDFGKNMSAERTRLSEIFREKEARNENVPRNEQISLRQRWSYQYTDPSGTNPDDPARVEYRVDGFGNGGMVRLVNPLIPSGPGAQRIVTPEELARNGVFVG